MLQRFRKSNISTKLMATALGFLIPIAALMLFMDLGFRYDINIAQTELTGISHLRQAAHDTLLSRKYHDMYEKHLLEGSVTRQELTAMGEQVAQALNDLAARHNEFEKTIGTAPKGLEHVLAGKPTPEQLIAAWNDALPHDEDKFTKFLTLALDYLKGIADCSLLSADPVLDSAHLANAVVMNIPLSLQEFFHLRLTIHHAAKGVFTSHDVKAIESAITQLEGSEWRGISASSQTAIGLDPYFYGKSPSLHSTYPDALKRYQKELHSFLTKLKAANGNIKLVRDLEQTAERTEQSLIDLFTTGLDELENLVQLRLSSYRTWQAGTYLFCITLTVLAALLAYRTYHYASRSITHVQHYAQRVSSGKYNTSVNPDLDGEMEELAGSISNMVQTLKHQLGYSQGILHGLTIPCIVLDTEENITFLNQSYLDLYERDGTPKDFIGMNLGLFYYGEANHETITGRAMKYDAAFREDEVEAITFKNHKIFVRFDVAPIHDLDGNITGAFAVITDLTKIKRQQRKIVELAAFAEANPSPVFAARPDGLVPYRNKAAQKAIKELELTNTLELLPSNHKELVTTCCTSGKTSEVFESTVGERVYSWIYHPLPDRSRVHIYALDITGRKRAEEQLLYDAYHDNLTGLPNKQKFIERIDEAQGRCGQDNTRFAVLVMDVDNFKHVNDSLGHSFGDKLISEIAWRLGMLTKPEDTLARLGGDEFALLIRHAQTETEAQDIASAIHNDLSREFNIGSSTLFTTVGIGIAMGEGCDRSGENLMRDADTAMYRAKGQGAGRTALFDEKMHLQAAQRLELETDMKHGIERKEFEPYYQPIIDLRTGRINGFEALVRWNHPEKGLVPPGMFIPLAEENGMVAPIGLQVLDQSLKQAQLWRNTVPGFDKLTMSVNVAEPQLKKGQIVEAVTEALGMTGFPSAQLKLEITESGAMNDIETAIAIQGDLKKLGTTLSIDDFGTGYSSLAHLTRFPFDFLKVDQSFVFAMIDGGSSMQIVKTIVSLAHGLGKKVIAEGVETAEALEVLRSLNVEYGQGYFFAKPLPAEEATALLEKNPTW